MRIRLCRPRSGRRPCTRAAFTLIELLVVISIMVLMVAILVPSVAGVLAQARSATCRQNLNGVYKFLEIYKGQNDTYYPAIGTSRGLVDAEWIRAISTYNKHTELYTCSAAKDVVDGLKANDNYWYGGTENAWKTTLEPTRTKWADGPVSGSYALNLWLSSVSTTWNYKTTTGAYIPVYGTEVAGAPSFNLSLKTKFWERSESADEDTPVMMDGYWMAAAPYNSLRYYEGTNAAKSKLMGSGVRPREDIFESYLKSGMDICALRRHGTRGCNVVFVNGTAREVDIREDLWKLKWHKDYEKYMTKPSFPDWLVNAN